ncbi:MAG: galactokinase, partial [Burkholderiales bacterium]
DHLVDIVGEVVGKRGGVRMTGGGFGGCVVALTTHALAQEAITQIAERYRSPQGAPATSFLCVPSDGVGTF